MPEKQVKTLRLNNRKNMLKQITDISVVTIPMINKFQNTWSFVKIDLLPGKNWIPLKITSGSSEFSEKPKVTDSGVMYEQKIKTEISSSHLDRTILQLEQFHLLVRIIYNDNSIEIIGCPDFPVRLTTELNVKQSSYYKFEFNCSTIYKAFRLLG